MNNVIENLTRDYFVAFGNKDENTLSRMSDENVELVDWEVNLTDRGPVMLNNKNLFESVKEIKITPKLIAVYGLTSMSKILVEIDGMKLNVVDIITFNNAGKIVNIEAYKQ
jgi:AAA+ ATPase superfamily predicted ATPase